MWHQKILLVMTCVNVFLEPTNSQKCQSSARTCVKSKYRSHDGSCNNIENPSWGTPFSKYGRLLPPKYGDGISSLTLSRTGKALPNPRSLSIAIYPDIPYTDRWFTLNAMQFGQIVVHDMSLTVLSNVPAVCCSESGKMLDPGARPSHCLPIDLPVNDPVYSPANQTCMGFIRTTTDRDLNCVGGSQPAEQLSQVTSFLDLSLVYGNNVEVNNQIRTFQNGLLRTETRGGQQWPIRSTNISFDCTLRNQNDACYFNTDDRINQNPQLTLLQVILYREHNRVAAQLKKLNAHWNDETIHQETRKIVISEYVYICYYEWLPLMLGGEVLYKNKILYNSPGQIHDYNGKINPAVLNEHAIAAFKHFHSLIAGRLDIVSESRTVQQSIQLRDWYFDPQVLENGDNFNGLTRGLCTQHQMASDRYHDKGVTNYLFSTGGLGLDLKATDIQRNRDHGLASYNELRKLCGLRRAKEFKDFLDVIPKEHVSLLEKHYEHPDDVDLIVGGSLERDIPGALVGPTFHYIILKQFYRTRVADRFWFENDQFTREQLKEIRKASISRLMCDNSNIKYMQRKGFVRISQGFSFQ
ncbi:peroxidase isoform X2 [Leptinotarsa decemlineata]|uniref:peroxidase isoform X2 n=1 Tax=Leptinotarsa decemlineata TaxID=7539 RepID=UPI003D305974